MSCRSAGTARANRCDGAAVPICGSRQCIVRRIRVAESFVARLVGLLGRRELLREEGLLIKPGGSVHTLGMRFAIDVLFLDRRMSILKIASALRPGRVAVAPRGTCCVLEIEAGRAASLGLCIGTQLAEQGACLWALGTRHRDRGLNGREV